MKKSRFDPAACSACSDSVMAAPPPCMTRSMIPFGRTGCVEKSTGFRERCATLRGLAAVSVLLSASAVAGRAGHRVTVGLPEGARNRPVTRLPGGAARDDAGEVQVAPVEVASHEPLKGEQAVVVGKGRQVVGVGVASSPVPVLLLLARRAAGRD